MISESKVLNIAIVMMAFSLSLVGLFSLSMVVPSVGATIDSDLEFVKVAYSVALTCVPSLILVLLPVKMVRG